MTTLTQPQPNPQLSRSLTALEDHGFRGAAISAVVAASKRSAELREGSK